jgi:predicted nucleic acid-binding protein
MAVPEHFFVEVSTVLRRWELNGVLKGNEAAQALDRLRHWPLRRAEVAPLLDAAWSYRHNMTVADALYVVLADRLNASLLTDDRNLANSPTFPAHVRRLTIPASQG